MSGDKVRRVIFKKGYCSEWRDDPNGTHALVPWETWERVVEHISNDECYCFELSGGTCHRCGFLEEIGGGDE